MYFSTLITVDTLVFPISREGSLNAVVTCRAVNTVRNQCITHILKAVKCQRNTELI